MSCKEKNLIGITATMILIVSLFLNLCSSIGITYFVISGIRINQMTKMIRTALMKTFQFRKSTDRGHN